MGIVSCSLGSSLPSDAPHEHTDSPRPEVRHVLLSAGARRQALDTKWGHRCLIPLRGMPLIAHILRQLDATNMKTVTIVVPPGDMEISKAVLEASTPLNCKVNVVESGGGGRGFFALSLMAARDSLPADEPILIATVDHLFDGSILSEFTTTPFDEEDVGVVLAELDWEELVGLPPSAVYLKTRGQRVVSIGPKMSGANAMEGGLMAVRSRQFFSTLSQIVEERALGNGECGHFSLADVLSRFADNNQLSFRPTAGRIWIAIETDTQLQANTASPACGSSDWSPADTRDSNLEKKALEQLMPWTRDISDEPGRDRDGIQLYGGWLRRVKLAATHGNDDVLKTLLQDSSPKSAPLANFAAEESGSPVKRKSEVRICKVISDLPERPEVDHPSPVDPDATEVVIAQKWRQVVQLRRVVEKRRKMGDEEQILKHYEVIGAELLAEMHALQNFISL